MKTMVHIEIKDAQLDLAKLVEQAAAGNVIIITRDQQPIVRLVAVTPRRRTFGSAKGMITIADDFEAPLDDFAEYQ